MPDARAILQHIAVRAMIELGYRLVVTHGNPGRAISDVRQVEAVFLGGRQVASRGHATLDARPTPWPDSAIALRTEYRSTDVGPRLPRA